MSIYTHPWDHASVFASVRLRLHPVSIHLYSSSGCGGLPQLESHAFSKTNDFYKNDNELMTHGGLWTLERNQRRTTGARVEAGNAWGLGDLVSQKAQSSSVHILDGKGMGTKKAQRVLETRYQYSQPGLPASSGTLHSLLC